jgi:hypothetical protein
MISLRLVVDMGIVVSAALTPDGSQKITTLREFPSLVARISSHR